MILINNKVWDSKRMPIGELTHVYTQLTRGTEKMSRDQGSLSITLCTPVKLQRIFLF